MRPAEGTEARLWLAALAAFAAAAALGAFVTSRPPARIDVEAAALRGEATSLAVFFTLLGRWYVVAAVAGIAALAAVATRSSPLTVALLLAWQTLSQGVNALLKLGFHRARPGGWLVQKEPDLSYPSGHSVTAIAFYGALLLLALRAPGLARPAAAALAALLAACIVGIPWSRLALGAHYFMDVAGGLLFGCGWLCAGLALLYRFGWLP
jgi:undecaprenyl-diphosphatase